MVSGSQILDQQGKTIKEIDSLEIKYRNLKEHLKEHGKLLFDSDNRLNDHFKELDERLKELEEHHKEGTTHLDVVAKALSHNRRRGVSSPVVFVYEYYVDNKLDDKNAWKDKNIENAVSQAIAELNRLKAITHMPVFSLLILVKS